MVMKRFSTFPKVPASLEPHHHLTYLGHSSYPYAEVQFVYSTARANWAKHTVNVKTVLFQIIQFAKVHSLDIKTVLFRAIQLSISTQFKCQNSSILNNSD